MLFSNLDLNKTYTYDDYYKWDFSERVELIDGKVYEMMAAPFLLHQVIVGSIYVDLFIFLKGKPCSVFIAPFDVRLPNLSNEDNKIYTVLQPDVCVVCDSSKLDKRGCKGAPDIVVEVLSPGNNAKEMKYKYNVYEQAGVKEYWVVFPDEEIVIIYTLVGGRYVSLPPITVGDVLTSAVLPEFTLNIAELFKNINHED